MTPEKFFAKAQRSLKTSKAMLVDGDPDAACNRAYYAMFNAARAALIAFGQAEAALAKTHKGLLSAFSLHLVKPGHLAAQLGRDFGEVANQRQVADYEGDEISQEVAAAAIKKANGFLASIKAVLVDRQPSE